MSGLSTLAERSPRGSSTRHPQTEAIDLALWGASSVTSAESPVGVMQRAARVETKVGHTQLNVDGTVSVTTADGYQVYRPVADGWQLLGGSRWGTTGYRTLGRSGRAWNLRGPFGEVSAHMEIADGKATVTGFHLKTFVFLKGGDNRVKNLLGYDARVLVGHSLVTGNP